MHGEIGRLKLPRPVHRKKGRSSAEAIKVQLADKLGAQRRAAGHAERMVAGGCACGLGD